MQMLNDPKNCLAEITQQPNLPVTYKNPCVGQPISVRAAANGNFVLKFNT